MNKALVDTNKKIAKAVKDFPLWFNSSLRIIIAGAGRVKVMYLPWDGPVLPAQVINSLVPNHALLNLARNIGGEVFTVYGAEEGVNYYIPMLY